MDFVSIGPGRSGSLGFVRESEGGGEGREFGKEGRDFGKGSALVAGRKTTGDLLQEKERAGDGRCFDGLEHANSAESDKRSDGRSSLVGTIVGHGWKGFVRYAGQRGIYGCQRVPD